MTTQTNIWAIMKESDAKQISTCPQNETHMFYTSFKFNTILQDTSDTINNECAIWLQNIC